VPRLDGLNVVFGRVLEGLEVVGTVAAVPSFQPDIRSQQLNRFAAFLGDERADKVARRWERVPDGIGWLGGRVGWSMAGWVDRWEGAVHTHRKW
jgi:hypothetical protein